MEVYVVNLIRAVDRRDAITKHLESLDQSFKLWPAVDGALLNDVDHDKFRREHPEYHHSRSSNSGINRWVGCTRSHQTLCQHIYDTWSGPVLVLEDDSVLEPAWAARVTHALSEQPTTELLLLGGYLVPRNDTPGVLKAAKARLTHAYLITTKEMAKDLAEVWLDESTELDEIWWKVMRKGTMFFLQPPVARQASGVSYITGFVDGVDPRAMCNGIPGLAAAYLQTTRKRVRNGPNHGV